MNVICSICSDQLLQADDIFYTRCGHVFHLHCLTPWLDRSKSCPQCREKVTQSKIHRLYFTFSSNDVIESQGSTLQERVDSLKFQILLKEKDIQYYSSKNVTLKKQNTGLKQEVRKVESEIAKKNSAIHALKEQMNYFKEQSSHCDSLRKENAKLKTKIEDLRPIQVLLNAPLSDVSKLVGKTKDPDTLTMYVSIMKKELIERFDKCKQLRMTVKKLQEELSSVGTRADASLREQDLEERLVISESKNLALQKRVDELEQILHINEKWNSVSDIEQTESKTGHSGESPPEAVSKKYNENAKTCNYVSKRKLQKKSMQSTRNTDKDDTQIGSNTSDSSTDFLNCSTFKDSPILSKKLKLSEDDVYLSIRDNNKTSNSIPRRTKKSSMRKKASEIEVNHLIDLT